MISKVENIITKYKKQDKSKDTMNNNPPKLKGVALKTDIIIKKKKEKTQTNPNNITFTNQTKINN